MLACSILRRLGVLLLCLACFASPALATWSILILNLTTGEVAIGIATCLTNFDLRPATVVVIPGIGVAAAQSFVGPLTLRQLIRRELLAGTPAQQILAQLAATDLGHQTRQYGIAGFASGTVAFTGTGAGAWAGGLTGQINEFVYTVQGNVLAGPAVNLAAEAAIRTTAGPIGDKLMAAMQAARAAGGDGRCSCSQLSPTACGAPPPNFTKSSHIGLMIVSRPSDLDAACTTAGGCGAGQYWLDLNVANQPATAPDPVLQLQTRYDAWKLQQIGRPDHYRSTVTLTSNRLRSNGIDTITGTVVLRDAAGNALGNNLPVTVRLGSRSKVTGVTFSACQPQPNGSYTFTMRGNLGSGLAVIDVAVEDGLGRVGVAPQPEVLVGDAFGDCGNSAIGNGQGGNFDALRIGGSAGTDRVVEVGLGQPFLLTLEPPQGPSSPLPVGLFALWAHLGLPATSAPLSLGQGRGSLCFQPFPLDPGAPTLLLADSFGLGGFVAASPAPWTLGFPGILDLIDVTLQAAMVTDLQGSLAATNAVFLRTTALPIPTIVSYAPVLATGGQTITVQGTDFLQGMELRVGGQPTAITSQTPTRITFSMPAGTGCDANFTLRNLGTAAAQRPLNPTPLVTSIPFTTGPAAGGALFALAGNHLLGCTVTIGGAPLVITNQSNNSIVGNTPPGTPGPATVVVRNSLGCQTFRTYTYQ
jgi:hypothetical protein